MRDNYSKTIIGQRVQLVPYRPKFVPRYHEWMQDPYLLEMTASEPLSLEGEYEMQRSWRDDPRKCTFIVLCAPNWYREQSGTGASETSSCSTDGEAEELKRMVGDVNLFLNDMDGDLHVAELEVMVGEARYRRCGFGIEAVKLMMHYGAQHLNIKRFYVKIGSSNTPSLQLFRR